MFHVGFLQDEEIEESFSEEDGDEKGDGDCDEGEQPQGEFPGI